MSDFNLRDVAAIAGVSVSTVSRVLRGISVDPAMERAVKEAADRLGYQPNGLAKALRGGRSGIIGLVVPDVSNPWYAELALAIEVACLRKDIGIVLCNSNNQPEQEERCLDLLWHRRVDGVMLVSVAGSPPRSQVEKVRRGWPMVAFDQSCAADGVDVVMADNSGGMRALTQHLVKTGRRRFGLLRADSGLQAARDRHAAAMSVLAESGISPVAEHLGDFTFQSGLDGASHLLTEHPDLEVIIAENDMMAVGAVQHCTKSGVRVPDDVAITGFDDMTMASWITPALTTVRQDREALADAALDMLLSRLSDPSLDARFALVACDLRIRDSSRPGKAALGTTESERK